jgi:hypothetical protein
VDSPLSGSAKQPFACTPRLANALWGDVGDGITLTVSRFDHWLDEDEAARLCTHWAMAQASGGREVYLAAEFRFIYWFEVLRESTEMWSWVPPRRADGRGDMVLCDDRDLYSRWVREGMREMRAVTFLAPEFELMVRTGYDLTAVVWCGHSSAVSLVGRTADMAGLHVLR